MTEGTREEKFKYLIRNYNKNQLAKMYLKTNEKEITKEIEDMELQIKEYKKSQFKKDFRC